MKKKLLIGLGVVAVLVISAMLYLNYRNRSLSPPGHAQYHKGDLTIEIPYSRPSKRGRLIFGSADDGALLPYGKYWRLGANEATEVTFSRDITFNGQPVQAGTYRMYAVPGKDTFEISLNSELGKWGYAEPDYSLDLLKTKVPVEQSNDQVEQFTIRFEEAGGTVLIVCEWDNVKIKIPVEAA